MQVMSPECFFLGVWFLEKTLLPLLWPSLLHKLVQRMARMDRKGRWNGTSYCHDIAKRRGGDSNPWRNLRSLTGLANRRFRPLSHLSGFLRWNLVTGYPSLAARARLSPAFGRSVPATIATTGRPGVPAGRSSSRSRYESDSLPLLTFKLLRLSVIWLRLSRSPRVA